MLSCRGCFLRGLKVQRVPEAPKLTVVVERGWSFIPKCDGTEKDQFIHAAILVGSLTKSAIVSLLARGDIEANRA